MKIKQPSGFWPGLLSTLLLSATSGASPTTQFCHVNPANNTDLCFALASSHNSTTGACDLSLHISARFPLPSTGWAAIGIGAEMAGALMFVMYPSSPSPPLSQRDLRDGPGEGGSGVTFSIRTTMGHTPPMSLTISGLAGHNGPEIDVLGTWVDDAGYSNVQLACYGCNRWSGSTLDVMSGNQSWIWAVNGEQETGTTDRKMRMKVHTENGIAHLDMSASYSTTGELSMAKVSDERVSTPAKPKHHAHSIFGLVSIHGFLLSSSFLTLSLGLLAIRSGLAKAFKYHWMIQLAASTTILIGVGMGVIISFRHGSKFRTTHQILGMFLGLGVVLQSWLGWRHHVLFLKIGRRTRVSGYHVWIGRTLVLFGNLNVMFGLQLSHASRTKYMFWLSSVGLQLAVLIPMWYFWSRGKKIMDVLGGKETKDVVERGGYEDGGVEEEAFLVGDDEEIELDEERHLHDKKEDTDLK